MILFGTDKKRGASRKTCPSIEVGVTAIYLFVPILSGIYFTSVVQTLASLSDWEHPHLRAFGNTVTLCCALFTVQRYNFILYYQNISRFFFFCPLHYSRPPFGGGL